MPSAEVVDVMFTFLQTVEALTQWGRISFLPLPPYYYPFILLYLPVTYSLVFSLPLSPSYSLLLSLSLTLPYLPIILSFSRYLVYSLLLSLWLPLTVSYFISLSLPHTPLLLPLPFALPLFSMSLPLILYLGSRWHK